MEQPDYAKGGVTSTWKWVGALVNGNNAAPPIKQPGVKPFACRISSKMMDKYDIYHICGNTEYNLGKYSSRCGFSVSGFVLNLI